MGLHLDQGRTSSQRLLSLGQGSSPVAEYTVNFQILAAEIISNKSALIAIFCNGLNLATQTKFACRDEGNVLRTCDHA